MFDLHERLLLLAHSLEGVQSELEGATERFYQGSPTLPGRLFLEVIEADHMVYGLLPHPLCHFRASVAFPHPVYPGWVRVAQPGEEEEALLWQSILYSYQTMGHSPALPASLLVRHPLMRAV